MKITASISIIPVKVQLDLPDGTPVGEIRDRVIEQARAILAHNGANHVVLAASHDNLVDGIQYLNDLGFPVLVERVIIEQSEPDWFKVAPRGRPICDRQGAD